MAEGVIQLTDPVEKYIPEFADLKIYAGMDGGRMVLKAPDRKPTIQDIFRPERPSAVTSSLARTVPRAGHQLTGTSSM